MTNKNLICAILAITIAALAAFPTSAQVPGITGRPLLKAPLTGDDSRETTIVLVEFAPGAILPAHTHPGDEYATLLEGTLELRAAGQEPRRVTAGQSFHNPRGVVHEARNVGDTIARLLNTFVLEKKQPLATPAPLQ